MDWEKWGRIHPLCNTCNVHFLCSMLVGKFSLLVLRMRSFKAKMRALLFIFILFHFWLFFFFLFFLPRCLAKLRFRNCEANTLSSLSNEPLHVRWAEEQRPSGGRGGLGDFNNAQPVIKIIGLFSRANREPPHCCTRPEWQQPDKPPSRLVKATSLSASLFA